MKRMMKTVWALFFACIAGACMTSCTEAEEGESWDDWKFRSAIDCGKYLEWSIYKVKEPNGEWGDPVRADIPSFRIQFFSSTHNFNSTKFSWIKKEIGGEETWVNDETTMEEYKKDNTAFTVDSKAMTIEGMVNGENYFRFTIDKEPTSLMEGKLYFYKEDKTYEVMMSR